MAQMSLSFSVEGDEEVVAMFDTTGRRAGNLRTPMAAIGDYFLEQIDDNFKGARGHVWERWKPRKKSYSHPLLEATGKMRSMFFKRTTRSSVTLGNDDPKFKYHQSKKPRSSNLPRRVMMAVAEEQRRESIRILQRYIMERR